MDGVINFILATITGVIVVNLSVAFIGVQVKQAKLIAPILLFSIVAMISKYYLHLSPALHTSLVVILNAFSIYLYCKIDFVTTLIGTLLGFCIFTFGSFLIICPILIYFGFKIPLVASNSIDWIVLSIAECLIPLIVLIILRATNLSLSKLISTLQEV